MREASFACGMRRLEAALVRGRRKGERRRQPAKCQRQSHVKVTQLKM